MWRVIIEILYALITLVGHYQRKQKEKEKENDVKALREDPAGWFNNHFSDGNDIVRYAEKSDANRTDKADDKDG